MKRLWWWFLARFRFSEWAVCEMSKGKGLFNDYHDWSDGDFGFPDHFVEYRCSRCGKGFYI